MTLTKRLVKGTAVTHQELDDNFDHVMARANHTGTQAAATISDFDTAADARIAAAVDVSVQAQDDGLDDIAALADPGADRVLFWDDSAGAYAYLTLGTGLTVTDDTVNAAELSDGDKGDITVSGTGTVWSIDGKPTGDFVGTSDTQTLTNKTIDGASNTLTSLPADAISGVIPIANLATGTPDGTQFIRDDGTLAAPEGSGNVSNSGTPTSGQAAEWLSATVVQGVAVSGTGSYLKGTSPTITTPTVSGVYTTEGAEIITPSAMGALAVDVTKMLNTKSISVDSTLTFSATPATNTWFGLQITNSDTEPHIVTIPSSFSYALQTDTTTFTIPAEGKADVIWRWDGTTYHMFGDTGVAGDFGAEASIASALTTDLDSVNSINVSITGTTTITGFGTADAGIYRQGRFTGALLLTHNATSLILPSGGDITTVANDRFGAISLGSGNWLVLWYQRADGTALVGGAGGGDVSSNTATTVDSEIALFSGTAGKTIKRMTGSGVVKVVSGVASAASVGTADVADAAITYAKIQDVSATDKILGRSTSGAGDVEEITCTSFGRAILDDTSHEAQRTTLSAAARAQTFYFSFFVSTVTDTDLLVVPMLFSGTVTGITTDATSGTCTLTGKINSTNLGGTANSVSSTKTTQAHASANAFVSGDDLVFTASSNSTCLGLRATVAYTRTLA